MKIKTITCHDVCNTGASLQAYALAVYLKNLGHDVKIINYKPPYLGGNYRLWGNVHDKYNKPFLREAYCLAKLPSRLKSRFGKRKKEFDSFTKQYLPLTKQVYTSNEELKANPPHADVFFAGSDQIWNTFFESGKDPAFYLDFAPKSSIKASYAPSFATESVVQEYRETVKKLLKNLDFISVRESSALKILSKMGTDGGVQVLDPVFLLEKTVWQELSKKWNNPEKKPYVLLYDFDRNPKISNFAKEIAKKHGWNVVSFLSNPFIKKDYSSEGPIAFLSLVENAELVISNSFHATAFSLIFEKEFFAFNRNEKINIRMRDLLSLAGLQEKLENEKFKDKTDYAKVNERLLKAVNESKEYIARVLSEGKNG